MSWCRSLLHTAYEDRRYPISGMFGNIVAGSAVENFAAQLPLFEAIAMS